LVGGGGVVTCSYTSDLCNHFAVLWYPCPEHRRPSNVDYEDGQHNTGSAVRETTHKDNQQMAHSTRGYGASEPWEHLG